MKNRREILIWMLSGTAGFALAGAASASSRKGRHARAAALPGPGLAGMAALDTPLTFSDLKIPLGELVQKVSEATGVPLVAAPGVWDEPVAVVVHDLPARELLENLAELLDYQWRACGDRETGGRGDGGTGRRGDAETRDARSLPTPNTQHPTPPLEIWQDPTSKAREAALRQSAIAELEHRLQEKLALHQELASLPEEQFQEILTVGKRRSQELKQLTDEERQAGLRSEGERQRLRRYQGAQHLSSPVSRALVPLVGGLTSEQWADLRRQGHLAFSTDPQPGELSLPVKTAAELRAATPTLYPPGMSVSHGSPQVEERFRLQERELQEAWASAAGFRVAIRFNERRLMSTGVLQVVAVPTPLLAEGAPDPEAVRNGPGTCYSLEARLVEAPFWSPEAPAPERPISETNSLLATPRRFQPTSLPPPTRYGAAPGQSWQLNDLLRDLARAYGVHFIGDAYWNTPRMLLDAFGFTEPVALSALLDRAAGPVRQWERHGSVIWLRSRTWFFDRPREVPSDLVRRWQELYARDGALSLDEHVAMAGLLDESQWAGLAGVVTQAGLPAELFAMAGDGEILRLLGALTPAQRQALWNGETILAEEMAPAPRALLMAAVKTRSQNQFFPSEPPARQEFGISLARGECLRRVREPFAGSTRYRNLPAGHPADGEKNATTEMPARPAEEGTVLASYSVQRVDLLLHTGTPKRVDLSLFVPADA